jgi:hypothetical protein
MAAINPAAHALPADSLASKLVVNRAPDHTEPAVFPAVASATSPSQGPCADAGAAQQLSDTQMVSRLGKCQVAATLTEARSCGIRRRHLGRAAELLA